MALNDDQRRAVVAELQAGRKIAAIKLYRTFTGEGLKESKEAVEELEQQMPQEQAELKPEATRNSGCLVIPLIFFIGGSAFLSLWL